MRYFRVLVIIFIISVQFSALAHTSNPMVHQHGTQLYDGNGKKLYLRGVNVEGWLSWSGHSWGGEFVSEQKIRDHLKSIVGAEATHKFEQQVYANYLTEQDIKKMSELGFNVVRVMFNHEILEDDARPFQYKASGWRLLDQLISWGERYNVYIVPCLMAAPGGQSNWFLADPDKRLLWHNPQDQQRTIALWRAIAKRYSQRKIIAGYDLLNEPNVFNTRKLTDLYQKIIKAIREVDLHHMVMLEGTQSAMNFSMFKRPLSDNQMYSYHVYHLIARRLIPDKSGELITKMKRLSNAHQVPLWVSEFGAHTVDWTKQKLASFESPNSGVSGWAFWPWKRVPSKHSEKDYMHLAGIRPTADWLKLINSVGKPRLASQISRQQALNAMNHFVEAMKVSKLDFSPSMLALLRSRK